jgi:hypothetical protein
MADVVRSGEGWRVSPADYAKTRPATFGVGLPRSQYVTMRDGCRLALDVYLPQSTPVSDAPRSKLPTLLILTPYYRRQAAARRPATTEPSPTPASGATSFVPRGWRVVVCDVRGTGASFGMRDEASARRPSARTTARSPIGSFGRRGPTGRSARPASPTSAPRRTSRRAPATRGEGHRAAVCRDTYSDHYYPGGLLLNRLAETYDELMIALDQDRRDLLGKFAYFKDPNFDWAATCRDDDPEGRLACAAVPSIRTTSA